MSLNKNAGFTLVELLVSIAIVIVLSVFNMPLYFAYLDRSAFSACEQELSTFKVRVMVADQLNDLLDYYPFEACSVNGSNQPTQLAVANALRGVFDGDGTSLVLNTQRPNVQARITSQGMVERVVTP
ncbi:pilus assembly protein PilA [Halomonas sp. 141]|uniref:type II secretion system protein n=1 Tax=Halomonas sp. 141 TaxID=2056666 RepID=UPI000C2965AB|nr:type II secretion system protein [Halomonas sp. 141]PJX15620.1 pilus assembly protein PilA [Halomonas sp. 141]